jgi:sphingolipid delta-4 desaturase
MSLPRTDYIAVTSPNPHIVRMKEILKSHPEVKGFYGFYRPTALWAFLLVSAQILMAYWMQQSPWWLLLILSYLIGATINHSLFVLLHEATHNLIFKRPFNNRLMGLMINIPHVFPSSMQFFKYHMLHHTNQSEFDYDADLASKEEATWIHNSRWRKFLTMFFFSFVQGTVRPSRLKKVKFLDGWFLVNILSQIFFMALVYYFIGWKAILYFFLSTLFGLGLHPFGGRWIQEHYVIKENQETNSYYGPLNKFCFNMGYHNEHHDFMKVPWVHLPKIKDTAPEHYDGLFQWKSWTKCLKNFIWNKDITFFDRYVRF